MIKAITRLIGIVGPRGGGTFVGGEGERIQFPPGAVVTHVNDGRFSSTTVEKSNFLGMPSYYFNRTGVSHEPSESDMVHYTVEVGGQKVVGSCIAECSDRAIESATRRAQELYGNRRFKRPRFRAPKPKITEWPHP